MKLKLVQYSSVEVDHMRGSCYCETAVSLANDISVMLLPNALHCVSEATLCAVSLFKNSTPINCTAHSIRGREEMRHRKVIVYQQVSKTLYRIHGPFMKLCKGQNKTNSYTLMS